MSLQVNLLNKTERRYQGIVSMKVMVLGSVGVLVGVTVLVLSLAGISKMTLNANLDRAQREWDRLNPLATAVRNSGYAATENQKTLDKLEGWAKGGRAPMYTVLRAVQGDVPLQMQFSTLFAGIREDETSPTESYYILRMNGRALGELVAVEAKRKLNADAEVRGFCGEVRLISSQREEGDSWTFALEGQRRTGGAQ